MGQCKEMVWDTTGFRKYQCRRDAKKDGYCTQHHPDSVALRVQKRDEKYAAELAALRDQRLRKKQDADELEHLRVEIERLKAELAIGLAERNLAYHEIGRLRDALGDIMICCTYGTMEDIKRKVREALREE